MIEYTPDQRKVVDYITLITEGAIGGGPDPVGFLIASHSELRQKLSEVMKERDALKDKLRLTR